MNEWNRKEWSCSKCKNVACISQESHCSHLQVLLAAKYSMVIHVNYWEEMGLLKSFLTLRNSGGDKAVWVILLLTLVKVQISNYNKLLWSAHVNLNVSISSLLQYIMPNQSPFYHLITNRVTYEQTCCLSCCF